MVTRPEMQSGSQPQLRRMVCLRAAKRLSGGGGLQHVSEHLGGHGALRLPSLPVHIQAICTLACLPSFSSLFL